MNMNKYTDQFIRNEAHRALEKAVSAMREAAIAIRTLSPDNSLEMKNAADLAESWIGFIKDNQ